MSNVNGLFIGRFQPFHLGHLSAIKQALKQVDRLYIGIGSSQYDHEEYNPFTGEERMEMIKRALEENGLWEQCDVFLVPDIHNDEKWTGHVRDIVPAFNHVFVGNHDLVKELFEKYDDAQVVEVEHEVDISATKIRSAITKEEAWEENLCASTAKYLKQIAGVKRIKQR